MYAHWSNPLLTSSVLYSEAIESKMLSYDLGRAFVSNSIEEARRRLRMVAERRPPNWPMARGARS